MIGRSGEQIRRASWFVSTMAHHHNDKWRFRCDAYWLWRLCLEVIELALALCHLHSDPPTWELQQIGSICINWIAEIDSR